MDNNTSYEEEAFISPEELETQLNQQRSERLKDVFSKIPSFYKYSLDIYNEINNARLNPKKYADYVLDLINNNYKENYQSLFVKEDHIYLEEGKNSLIEAFNFLSNLSPLKKLKLKKGLCKSAEELLDNLKVSEKPETKHITDNSCNNTTTNEYNLFNNISCRMSKHGVLVDDNIYEIIDSGNVVPELVVLNLIICDGNFSRHERDIIFNRNVRYIGIASDILPSEKICTVLNFAGLYFELGDPVPSRIYNNNKDFFDYKLSILKKDNKYNYKNTLFVESSNYFSNQNLEENTTENYKYNCNDLNTDSTNNINLDNNEYLLNNYQQNNLNDLHNTLDNNNSSVKMYDNNTYNVNNNIDMNYYFANNNSIKYPSNTHNNINNIQNTNYNTINKTYFNQNSNHSLNTNNNQTIYNRQYSDNNCYIDENTYYSNINSIVNNNIKPSLNKTINCNPFKTIKHHPDSDIRNSILNEDSKYNSLSRNKLVNFDNKAKQYNNNNNIQSLNNKSSLNEGYIRTINETNSSKHLISVSNNKQLSNENNSNNNNNNKEPLNNNAKLIIAQKTNKSSKTVSAYTGNLTNTRTFSRSPDFNKIANRTNNDGSKNLQTSNVVITPVKAKDVNKVFKYNNAYTISDSKRSIKKNVFSPKKYNLYSYEDRFWNIIKKKPELKSKVNKSRRSVENISIKNPFDYNYNCKNILINSKENNMNLENYIQNKDKVILKLRNTKIKKNKEEKYCYKINLTNESFKNDNNNKFCFENRSKSIQSDKTCITNVNNISNKLKHIILDPCNFFEFLKTINIENNEYEDIYPNIYLKLIKNHINYKLTKSIEDNNNFTSINILSIDNINGYYSDFECIKLLIDYFMANKELNNLKYIKFNYYLNESDKNIIEHLNYKLKEFYKEIKSIFNLHNKHYLIDNFNIKVLEYDINLAISKQDLNIELFDLILVNKISNRLKDFMISDIEMLIENLLNFISKDNGELLILTSNINSDILKLKESYINYKCNLNIKSNNNICLFENNKTINIGDAFNSDNITNKILNNTNFNLKNEFLIGTKSYNQKIKVNNMIEMKEKEAVYKASQFLGLKLNNLQDINKIKSIVNNIKAFDSKEYELTNKEFYYINDSITGFYFKHKTNNLNSYNNKLTNEFKLKKLEDLNEIDIEDINLSENIKKICINKKPFNNGYIVRKNIIFINGEEDIIEVIY